MTEWSLFISKVNHSVSRWSKPMPQPVTLKKLKWTVIWRPIRPFRTNTQKRCPFHYRGLEWKSRKSRDTWLLLSCFSRVQLCTTPETVAHQAPPSLRFSRQEHWSGLPFPSPMHESEKWKWSRLVVSDSERPHRLQPTRLFRPWDFPGKSTGVGCHCLLREPQLPHTNQ